MPANTPSVASLLNGAIGINEEDVDEGAEVESVEAAGELDDDDGSNATVVGWSSLIAESSLVSTELFPSGFDFSDSAPSLPCASFEVSVLALSALFAVLSSTASKRGNGDAIVCIVAGSGSGSPS